MEDGNAYNSLELENKIPSAGDRKSANFQDKYINVNGGSDLFNRVDKKNNSSVYDIHVESTIQHKNQEKLAKSKSNASESNNQPIKVIPRPIITKHSTFKTVLKRSTEEHQRPNKIVCKENGDQLYVSASSTSKDRAIDEDALQKAIIKLHNSSNNKSKNKLPPSSCKKRKVDESGCSAQYLGLQPAVKFKCSKCSSTFPSLVMLKQHQRSCAQPHKSLPASMPTSTHTTNTCTDTNLRFTRSVYLCSACGTYYENWNLFLHIREVHNRHTCLFCFGMFSQAHKLASHLIVKHNIQEDYFTCKEDLSSKFTQSFYLLCCKCEKIFTEREDFVSHECVQVIKQCSVCKLKGSHSPLCPKNSKIKKASSITDFQYKKIKIKPPIKPCNELPVPASESGESKDLPLKNDLATLRDSEMLNDKDINVTPVIDSVSDTSLCQNISNETNGFNNHLTETNIPLNQTNNNNNNGDNKEGLVDMENENKANESQEAIQESSHIENNLINNNSTEIAEEKHKEIVGTYQENNMEINDIPPTNVEMDNSDVSSNLNAPSEPQAATTEVLYQIHPSVSWPRKYTPQLPSKPPPRNRRPPKRYQTSESPEEQTVSQFHHQPIIHQFTPEQPVYQQQEEASVAVSEVKETVTVNRVPKLTVKIPKRIIEKESTSDYSSESEDSDKLTVDVDAPNSDVLQADNDLNNESDKEEKEDVEGDAVQEENDIVDNHNALLEADIVVAGEDTPLTELTLDHPLDKYSLKELLKVFLSSTINSCIYCNHARKIAVNAKQLGLHFVAQHRFSATVNSITAEELFPDTIVYKIKTSLDEVENIYLNLEGFETFDTSQMKFYDQTLECFQCFYITKLQKDLYSHNRKMHQKTILLCVMCKSNFYSYSELLCHLCPGTYELNSEITFHCCLCPKDSIPSAFRLMVHLRKSHKTCDVCLESCHNQTRLSNHVWKHKLHHLCYRCGIAYRNKPDITKHLFWKHGTESVLCKKCMQKRWPHVYHFCVPPNSFICEECNLTFTKAVSLKVHKRLHNNDYPYSCPEEKCEEKFISKKLLNKHEIKHLEPTERLDDPSKQHSPIDDKNEIIVIDDKPDDVIDAHTEKIDNQITPLKPRKSKKNKKAKEKVNLLIDVNLPELNLSESDSSEGSDTESTKKHDNETKEPVDASNSTAEPMLTEEATTSESITEEVKSVATVPDVWDNFKMYQAQMEKETVSLLPPKPKHVCESDHDYCVIPINNYDKFEEQHRRNMEGLSPNKENKRRSKAKKKSVKKDDGSSSSDSSSDSDSSCSCGSNCSCSSSSGSSSSSSSSDSDSESLSSSPKQEIPIKPHKDSSDASAVDVVMPLPEPVELPIGESDLDTDETDTDEDFYDEHPQRLANKMLAEKRNKLMLLATVAPSVNNGTYIDSSRPATPEVENIPEIKKKVKNKKKKKPKKSTPLVPPIKIPLRVEEQLPCIVPNKITISLHTNTVIDKSGVVDSPKMFLSTPTSTLIDNDYKRASKRRRVPNKFYGYSSDEDYIQKQQIPPKLEWRKEDLPSSSGVQQQPQPSIVPEYPTVIEQPPLEPRHVISPKLLIKEPIYTSSEDEDSDSSGEGALQINHPIAENIEPIIKRIHPMPPYPYGAGIPFPRPAGVRQAREGESVYCYCRCPYDEVSEMIACDAEGCSIEWFHFECVGIMVPPKGKWFCPDCRQKDEYCDQM